MITTGSTRGKCSAEQAGQRREIAALEAQASA